ACPTNSNLPPIRIILFPSSNNHSHPPLHHKRIRSHSRLVCPANTLKHQAQESPAPLEQCRASVSLKRTNVSRRTRPLAHPVPAPGVHAPGQQGFRLRGGT